jgi:hypothetical protein
MAIPDGHKTNLETIKRAAENNNLGVLECKDTKTGEVVHLLIATMRDQAGEYDFIPLAQMFTENPYERFLPPDPDRKDGFHGEH